MCINFSVSLKVYCIKLVLSGVLFSYFYPNYLFIKKPTTAVQPENLHHVDRNPKSKSHKRNINFKSTKAEFKASEQKEQLLYSPHISDKHTKTSYGNNRKLRVVYPPITV